MARSCLLRIVQDKTPVTAIQIALFVRSFVVISLSAATAMPGVHRGRPNLSRIFLKAANVVSWNIHFAFRRYVGSTECSKLTRSE